MDTEKLKFLYPVLLSCDLDRSGLDDDEAEGSIKPIRYYKAGIRHTHSSGRLNIAMCEFAGGEKANEKILFEASASYFVAFETGGEELTEAEYKPVLERLAGVSAWAQFRTLFSVLVSQSNEDLPALPSFPKIGWLEDGEEPGSQTSDFD
jgi:hypothetical protein